jgi:hypothetical protein
VAGGVGVLRSWRGLLVCGAIAVAALVAVLAIPSAIAATSFSAFAAFLSATLTATALTPLLVARIRSHPSIPFVVAAALLTLGAAAYLYGGSVQARCVVQYNGRGVLVGTTMTDIGVRFMQAHPDETMADLLESSSGDPSIAWTRESIAACRTRVASTYFLWIPFLTAALASAALGAAARRLAVPAAAAIAPEVAGLPARYDVFISYRHGGADEDVAHQLLQSLEADGYSVGIDARDFAANASFLQEMERCIRESRYTVAIVSGRYLESGHCEEEAIISKVLDMGQRRRRLIPFVIQRVPMPAWLFGIVGIDCTEAEPLVDPIERLKATLGPPRQTRTGTAAV